MSGKLHAFAIPAARYAGLHKSALLATDTENSIFGTLQQRWRLLKPGIPAAYSVIHGAGAAQVLLCAGHSFWSSTLLPGAASGDNMPGFFAVKREAKSSFSGRRC
jgi:hypothetical protein